MRPRVELVPAGRLWYVVRTIADIIIVIDGPGYPTPLAAAVAASRRYRAELLHTLEGAQETAVDVPAEDATMAVRRTRPGTSRARKPPSGARSPNAGARSLMATKFTPAWLELHRVDVSSLRRADVVGIGHVLGEIDASWRDSAIRTERRPWVFEPPRGILLHGEPGLGKTLMARYLAASLASTSRSTKSAPTSSTPERIRGALRHLAAAHPRSVLYADEIDTIGMARDFSGHDSDTRMRLTALLAALDGLTATDGPVVIASSNRPPYVLDAALTRSGRLGFKVRFDAPDEDERIELFMLFTRQVPSSPGDRLASCRTADSGQEPGGFAPDHRGRGVLALVPTATRSRLSTSSRPSVATGGSSLSRRIPRTSATGSPSMRLATSPSASLARRSPGGLAVRLGVTEGHTLFGDERVPRAMRGDDENRDAIIVSFGGVAAERAILGEAASGGGSDVSAERWSSSSGLEPA